MKIKIEGKIPPRHESLGGISLYERSSNMMGLAS